MIRLLLLSECHQNLFLDSVRFWVWGYFAHFPFNTALNDFVGNLPGELHLCLVRAILAYYKRVMSEGLSRDKVKLFFYSVNTVMVIMCLP